MFRGAFFGDLSKEWSGSDLAPKEVMRPRTPAGVWHE